MIRKKMIAAGVMLAGLAGCGSGDINVAPSTTVTDSNNTNNNGNGGGTANPCASYVNTAGQTIQGAYDGTNCTYAPSFVDAGNNLTVDMTIPALANNGAHIFQGSLFVGNDYSSDAALAANGITEGGDGPVLTIEAGARIAFSSNSQFMVINRGSQIFAVGRSDAPITLTSLSDINGTVGPQDVQQWGGLVIDGFGVTNKCAYTGSVAAGNLGLASQCHVESEGSLGLDENHYGGVNNDDSSGRLEYVIIKHTGATVGNGDELNGITFGAVGRNTIVKNIEVYSVYDDGLEFFGGAVNVENYLALYVRDDSLDFDEGYSGTITNALIVQSETDGNSCLEADGIADYDDLDDPALAVDPLVEAVIAQGINSRPTINHMTCIFSANGPATATHEPGIGLRMREGIFATINDSLVIGSFSANDQAAANDNYCLRIDNRSQRAALDGDLQLNSVIWSCAERTRGQTFPDGVTTEESFAVAEGNVFATVPNNTAVDPTAAADAGLQLLEGAPPVYSIAWSTSLVDGAAPAASTQPTTAARAFLGATSTTETDWTKPWAYGLDPAKRAVALWFE
jgi:hypothetical protein